MALLICKFVYGKPPFQKKFTEQMKKNVQTFDDTLVKAIYDTSKLYSATLVAIKNKNQMIYDHNMHQMLDYKYI